MLPLYPVLLLVVCICLLGIQIEEVAETGKLLDGYSNEAPQELLEDSDECIWVRRRRRANRIDQIRMGLGLGV